MGPASVFRTASEVGLNLRRLRLAAQFPRFLADLRRWKRLGGKVSTLFPILGDWTDQAGEASGVYFHQDLLVARRIYVAKPQRHVDVGSRIDGFVAHVAVFREIEVVDIRPLASQVRNVRFIQADLMQGTPGLAARP